MSRRDHIRMAEQRHSARRLRNRTLGAHSIVRAELILQHRIGQRLPRRYRCAHRGIFARIAPRPKPVSVYSSDADLPNRNDQPGASAPPNRKRERRRPCTRRSASPPVRSWRSPPWRGTKPPPPLGSPRRCPSIARASMKRRSLLRSRIRSSRSRSGGGSIAPKIRAIPGPISHRTFRPIASSKRSRSLRTTRTSSSWAENAPRPTRSSCCVASMGAIPGVKPRPESKDGGSPRWRSIPSIRQSCMRERAGPIRAVCTAARTPVRPGL